MKQEEKISYGNTMIAWQAREFVEHKRGRLWVSSMSAIAILLILYGILTDSIAFSIVVVLLAGVFFLTHDHKPKIVDVYITDLGILFDNRFYAYEDISAFWILYDPPHVKTLNFKTSKGLLREIAIQLEDQNPAEIKAFLSAEVPEIKNRTETLSEILIRILKL
jgi:predicted membrane protein